MGCAETSVYPCLLCGLPTISKYGVCYRAGKCRDKWTQMMNERAES